MLSDCFVNTPFDAALQCLQLEAPQNGSINCSSQTVNGTCFFSCDPSFSLRGSIGRTCLSSREWSGLPTCCDPPMCPELTPPENGFVQFPCTREESHTCTLLCAHGYNMTGSLQQMCVFHNDTLSWSEAPVCQSKLR